jgi:hypothetical protein
MSIQADEERTLQQERAAAIAHLESRARRRRLGIRWPTALFALVLAAGVLWMMRGDLAYFFSPRVPLTLGSQEGYHLEALASNRYAQIHGQPTARGAFLHKGGQSWVIVGLQGTPVLVRRPALPGEDWEPGRPAPPPDTRAFGVRGRLLAEQDAKPYSQGFELIRTEPEMVAPDGQLWILLAQESPGQDTGQIILAGFVLLFLLGNVWLFARDIAVRLGARGG